MKTLCLWCLAASTIAFGCSRRGIQHAPAYSAAQGAAARNDPLNVWRNPRASPIEKRDAVLALVPRGSKVGRAIEILGHPDRIEHISGPVFSHPTIVTLDGRKYVEPGPPDGYIDEDRISYLFRTGDVLTLTFQAASAGTQWEQEPLLWVTLSKTNNLVRLQ